MSVPLSVEWSTTTGVFPEACGGCSTMEREAMPREGAEGEAEEVGEAHGASLSPFMPRPGSSGTMRRFAQMPSRHPREEPYV